jgi:hypothetical protein
MGVAFFRGQQLGRQDLNIYLTNANNTPSSAANIYYGLYDYTTGQGVLVGPLQRNPVNPSIGEYYASVIIPLDANLGNYRIKWTFQDVVGGEVRQVVQEFSVVDKTTGLGPDGFGFPGGNDRPIMKELAHRLRVLLRDNSPDRNYHFRPPTHERTIEQYSKVFGYIWEQNELYEYIDLALNMIIAYPPRTPFASVEQMVQSRREWTTVLLTGAMLPALQAVRINWVADEFEYSIGGVSLNLDKASKYEAALTASTEQFDKQLEKAKATVNFIKGLQQPKYGTGIRSAFGPYVGRGVLSPRKFMGF